jgi:hypothetical protein
MSGSFPSVTVPVSAVVCAHNICVKNVNKRAKNTLFPPSGKLNGIDSMVNSLFGEQIKSPQQGL